jgi:hypothetical protein
MRIWHLVGAFAPMVLGDKAPTIQRDAAGGVVLDLSAGRRGNYRVELAAEECERIAAAIDWQPREVLDG